VPDGGVPALWRFGACPRCVGQMQAQGFDAAQLAVYEQELNEPTPDAVQALVQLIDSGKRISAEIAARMMVQDYPSSMTARDCLARVMEMGVEVEAVKVT
jgi:hypothetical protein